MKKGLKPEAAALDAWLASRVEIDAKACHRARGLWLEWSDHARLIEVERGTPRTFSNELRRRGFPVVRPHPARRTRFHAGLRMPWRPMPGAPAWAVSLVRGERY